MSDLPGKADTDVKREMQIASLRADLSKAKTLKEYAWLAIQNGCDPVYIAIRYGFPVEDLKRAKEVYEAREAEKRARNES